MKNKIIITIIILLVISFGVWQYYIKQISKQTEQTEQEQQIKQKTETEVGIIKSLTKEEAPKDIKIPEVGEEALEKEIAIPIVVTEAAPNVESKFRIFDIKAESDAFSPSTIIIKKGDTVHINFMAIDKTYDITFPDYGMKQIAKKGEKKVLEFQAVSEGKFTYYCDSCGGLNSSVKGYIIITQ